MDTDRSFSISDFNLDFMDCATPLLSHRPAAAGFKASDIAKRIADCDDMVRRLQQADAAYNKLQSQLQDFQETAKEIQRLYETEKSQRCALQQQFEMVNCKYVKLDDELAHKTLQLDQLQAQWEAAKGPLDYRELAVKYIKLAHKLNDEHSLYWAEKSIVSDLQKYCEERGCTGLPLLKSPKKRMRALKCEKAIQCQLEQVLPARDTPKEKHDQSTQCDEIAKATAATCQSTQCEAVETRAQGTQHIPTTTTRSTSTACFIKQHHVGTMYPEPAPSYKKQPAFDDILQELRQWKSYAPLSPIADLQTEECPLPAAAPKTLRTVGTCTFLCNVRRQIDFVPQLTGVKRSHSRSPTRSSCDNVKFKREAFATPSPSPPPPYIGTAAVNSDAVSGMFAAAFPQLSQLQPNVFATFWQMVGQMLLGLLHPAGNNGAAGDVANLESGIYNTTCDDNIQLLQQRQFNSQQESRYKQSEDMNETPPPSHMAINSDEETNRMENIRASQYASRVLNRLSLDSPIGEEQPCDASDPVAKESPTKIRLPQKMPRDKSHRTKCKCRKKRQENKIRIKSDAEQNFVNGNGIAETNEMDVLESFNQKITPLVPATESEEHSLLHTINWVEIEQERTFEERSKCGENAQSEDLKNQEKGNVNENKNHEAKNEAVTQERPTSGNEIRYEKNSSSMEDIAEVPSVSSLPGKASSNATSSPKSVIKERDMKMSSSLTKTFSNTIRNPKSAIELLSSFAKPTDSTFFKNHETHVLSQSSLLFLNQDDPQFYEPVLVIDEKSFEETDAGTDKVQAADLEKETNKNTSKFLDKSLDPMSKDGGNEEEKNVSSLLSCSEMQEILASESINKMVDALLAEDEMPNEVALLKRRGRKRRSNSMASPVVCKRSERLQKKRTLSGYMQQEAFSSERDLAEPLIVTKSGFEQNACSDDPLLIEDKCASSEQTKRITEDCDKPIEQSALKVFSEAFKQREIKADACIAIPKAKVDSSFQCFLQKRLSALKKETLKNNEPPPNYKAKEQELMMPKTDILPQVAIKENTADDIQAASSHPAASNEPTKSLPVDSTVISFDAPASPSIADCVMPITEAPSPKEIPLELSAAYYPRKRNTILNRLIATYSADQYKIVAGIRSKQELQQSELLKAEIQLFLQSKHSNLDVGAAALIRNLDAISADLELITGAIIEQIKQAPRPAIEIGCALNEVPPKYLTMPLRHITVALRHFHYAHPNCTTTLLAKIESSLFKYNGNDNLSLNEVLNLTQLYLLIIPIQYTSSEPNPARLFIAKCLYYYVVWATPMIYEVLCCYPTTLPHREDRSYDRSDSLITVIQHVLMCTNYDMESKDLRTKELLSMLRYQYHYQPFKPDASEVLTNLIAKLRAGKLANIKYAFALFCKRMHPTKTMAHVLQANLVPLTSEYYKQVLQSADYDERAASLLECMTTIAKPLPITTDIDFCFAICERFLNAVHRPIIQEAAVLSILRLQRFNHARCFRALLNFAPTYPLQALTKNVLKTFIHRRPIKLWNELLEETAH